MLHSFLMCLACVFGCLLSDLANLQLLHLEPSFVAAFLSACARSFLSRHFAYLPFPLRLRAMAKVEGGTHPPVGDGTVRPSTSECPSVPIVLLVQLPMREIVV